MSPAARQKLAQAEKLVHLLQLRDRDPGLVPDVFDRYTDDQLAAFLASTAVELHHELNTTPARAARMVAR